jgi:hypothetical protein
MADRFTIVKAAEKALRELDLGCLTQADKLRCDKVRRGMMALDTEQCDIKNAIARLVDALGTGYSASEVIEDLKTLVARWDNESKRGV